MSAFMEEYEKSYPKIEGVPNYEMNRPFSSSGTVGDIGLELEIEGNNLPSQGSLEKIFGGKSGARWNTKTDGSLRGEALEYVLSTPCFVDEVEGMVSGLYSRFNEIGTRLQLSNRCSTHVHVNMSGKKINEITSALALWAAFEEPLTIWAGEERVNNHFCLTSKDSNQGTIAAWRGFLRTGRSRFSDNLKYSAQNLLTLSSFGSLEYRVMNASEDPRKIIDWTKFIFTMTREGSGDFKNPKSLLYAMSERGGREMFRNICDKAGVSEAFVLGVENTVPDINRSVLEGFRRAQPIVAGFDWDAWLPEIEKKYVANPFGKKKKGPLEILDIDWTPRPTTATRTIRMDRIGAPVPPEPPEPREEGAEPERPAYVPANFVFRNMTGQWHHPDADNILRLVRTLRGRHTHVDFSEYEERPVDWSRPVRFADGTAAIVLAISSQNRTAQVIATSLISDGMSDLNNPYWYDTQTGKWSGGTRGAAIVRNI